MSSPVSSNLPRLAPAEEPERMDQVTANQVGSGAPGTLTIKGEVLLVNQPTRADFVTLAKYLKDLWKRQHGGILQDTVKELAGIEPQYHEAILKAAVQCKQTVEPTQENLNDMLLTLDGSRFWVWHLARYNHADLLLAKMSELVDENNHSQVLADLFLATDMNKVQQKKT